MPDPKFAVNHLGLRVRQEFAPAVQIGHKVRIEVRLVELAAVKQIHRGMHIAPEPRGSLQEVPWHARILV